jgi:hypothetical protein
LSNPEVTGRRISAPTYDFNTPDMRPIEISFNSPLISVRRANLELLKHPFIIAYLIDLTLSTPIRGIE